MSNFSKPIWYGPAAGGLLLLILLATLLVRSRKRRRKSEPTIPEFVEVFSVDIKHFVSSPYKAGDDSEIAESILKTITLTLLVGLREFLTKIFENPSNQQKALLAIAKDLEAEGITPIAYMQWNQSAIQGVAAKVIVNGVVRNALLGPTLAMARATAKFPESISAIVENAHSEGNSIYVLGIDGLAYGVFEVSHKLQEVIKEG